MMIRFERWDLAAPDGITPVLRLVDLDGHLTDPDHADCFDSPLAAAEAAWRLAGAPEDGSSWLDRARDAFDEDPKGRIAPSENPRVLTSRDMGAGDVQWLDANTHLTAGTGEWALVGQAIEAAGSPETRKGPRPQSPPLPRGLEGDPPLSGTQTAEWPFASLAGRGGPKPVPEPDE